MSLKVTKQYQENGYEIVEYNNGQTVVKYPINNTPDTESIPLPPSLDQQIKETKEENTLLKQQLSNMNADFQALMDTLVDGGVI